MPTLSLEDLRRRIANRDTELQRLRQQLEARNSQLSSLTQRKEALQTQLLQVEAEMAALAAGHKRAQTAAPKPAPPNAAVKPRPAGKAAKPSLPSLILSLIQEAGRPPYETVSPTEARELYLKGRAVTNPEPPELLSVAPLTIPSPTGSIPARLYTPKTLRQANAIEWIEKIYSWRKKEKKKFSSIY